MILRPFLGNQPLVLGLLIPVVALFVGLNMGFDYHVLNPKINLGLLGKFESPSYLVSAILAAVFVLANAFFLNFLFNKHDFLERNSYAPSLFYVVFMTFSQSFYFFNNLLIVHFLLLLIFRLLFMLETGERNGKHVFNIGLFTGMMIVILPQSAALLPFIWIGARLNKVLSIRDLILLILGSAIIVFNGLMFWWFSGHSIGLRILRISGYVKYEKVILISTGVVVLIYLLLSSIGVRVRIQKSSIRFKKINRSILVLVLGTLLMGAGDLIFYQQVEWFNLVFVPVGFLFTFAFIHRFWKQVATVFFYLTFSLAVIKFFIHAGWFN